MIGMSTQTFMFAEPDSDPLAPLKFDRRSSERHDARGVVTAQPNSGSRLGRVTDLVLVDESVGGFGAISQVPLEPGTSIWLTGNEFTTRPRRAIVIRCAPCGDGYQIGVRYELAMAA